MKISTDRLDLVAATFAHVQAELDCTDRLAQMLGSALGPEWPPGEHDRDAQEYFLDCLQKGGPAATGWHGWYVIIRDPQAVVIGTGGYHGLPRDNGDVEIGFSIMTGWQKRGYATELVRALVARAFSHNRVSRVIAQTTAGNSASCKVLEKAGFQLVVLDQPQETLCFELHRPD